jgi:hypothetical protein
LFKAASDSWLVVASTAQVSSVNSKNGDIVLTGADIKVSSTDTDTLTQGLGKKFDKANITQALGTSTTNVMSQKAVTDAIGSVEGVTFDGPYDDLRDIIDPQTNVIYLVGTEPPYEEYLHINDEFEVIGSTTIDLSEYAKTAWVNTQLGTRDTAIAGRIEKTTDITGIQHVATLPATPDPTIVYLVG